MFRILRIFTFVLVAGIAEHALAQADGPSVNIDLPPEIETCFKDNIIRIFSINRSDQESLFEFFLSSIDVDLFGRYNFKRAWVEWGRNTEIRRLALYEYLSLMSQRRAEHGGDTVGVDVRLADRAMVTGDNIYHVVARARFADGSSVSIVVFAAGCKAFGFAYGGTNLRAFVNVSLIERLYRNGKRAPF